MEKKKVGLDIQPSVSQGIKLGFFLCKKRKISQDIRSFWCIAQLRAPLS